MKLRLSRTISTLSITALILAGCQNSAEQQLSSASPNKVSSTPSASPLSLETAAPTPTVIPETGNLYPYYVYERNTKGAEFTRSKLWGYMDRAGKPVIQPIFSSADPFNSKGIAIVKVLDKKKENELYGLIDRSGVYLLESKYVDIQSTGGIFVAITSDKHSLLLGEDGHTIKTDIAGEIGEFSEGKAPIKVGEQYGFVDLTGKVMVNPQYSYVYAYQNGKALVKLKDGVDGLLNEEGEQLHKYNAHYVLEFSEGLAATMLTEDSKYGYMNEDGELVIAAKFENAEAFHEGLAAVSLSTQESKSGLINAKGKYVLQPQYGDIIYLGRSLWAVSKSTRQMVYNGEADEVKYALFNSKAEKITDDVFDSVRPFVGDYAVVQQGVSSFLIDSTGHKAKEWPVVEGIGNLQVTDDMLAAEVDNDLKYVTADGNVVWQTSYTYDLGDGASLKEVKYRPNPEVLVFYPQLVGLKNKEAETKLNELFKQATDLVPEEEGQFDYDESFSVAMQQKDLLVIDFSSYSYEGGAHGMPGRSHYHINLQTGEVYTLKDLFLKDSGYLQKLNQSLKKLIKEQGEEKGVFMDTELGFEGLAGDHLFYVDKDTLHIEFSPYEIGSYAAGFITFDIPLKDLEQIINKKGSFWQAFH